jgi:hypothetical protein
MRGNATSADRHAHEGVRILDELLPAGTLRSHVNVCMCSCARTARVRAAANVARLLHELNYEVSDSRLRQRLVIEIAIGRTRCKAGS